MNRFDRFPIHLFQDLANLAVLRYGAPTKVLRLLQCLHSSATKLVLNKAVLDENLMKTIACQWKPRKLRIVRCKLVEGQVFNRRGRRVEQYLPLWLINCIKEAGMADSRLEQLELISTICGANSGDDGASKSFLSTTANTGSSSKKSRCGGDHNNVDHEAYNSGGASLFMLIVGTLWSRHIKHLYLEESSIEAIYWQRWWWSKQDVSAILVDSIKDLSTSTANPHDLHVSTKKSCSFWQGLKSLCLNFGRLVGPQGSCRNTSSSRMYRVGYGIAPSFWATVASQCPELTRLVIQKEDGLINFKSSFGSVVELAVEASYGEENVFPHVSCLGIDGCLLVDSTGWDHIFPSLLVLHFGPLSTFCLRPTTYNDQPMKIELPIESPNSTYTKEELLFHQIDDIICSNRSDHESLSLATRQANKPLTLPLVQSISFDPRIPLSELQAFFASAHLPSLRNVDLKARLEF